MASHLYIRLFILMILFASSEAWHDCPSGGICPDGNMCCSTGTNNYSTCLSGEDSSDGSCCVDDKEMKGTGCQAGFSCSSENHYNNNGQGYYFCKKLDPTNDKLPDRLPRNRLCHVPERVLKEVYGFSVLNDASDKSDMESPQLAYLSTMGPIDDSNPKSMEVHSKVKTLVVMIHGSLRNVDDYICCANSALPSDQQNPQNSTTMIVTPWFLTPEDEIITFNNTLPSVEPLQWALNISSTFHTWRYGADAVNANFSSYAAVDSIVNYVVENKVRFPSLERIVVAGHSAGGQFTQRWALLTNSKVFANETNIPRVSTRVVVANPKSYCYLDNRRILIDGRFRNPQPDTINDCPTYNDWEWGFGNGSGLLAPYKDEAIRKAGGVDNVINRYSLRDVVYLSGEEDILYNGSCEDKIQGVNRRERSEKFFKSLEEIYGYSVHNLLVVPDVNHDHCLMFQSRQGKEALFGDLGFNEQLDVISSG